jgi:hypothetical protein
VLAVQLQGGGYHSLACVGSAVFLCYTSTPDTLVLLTQSNLLYNLHLHIPDCLQSSISTLLAVQGSSLDAAVPPSFQEARADPALLSLAQSNSYPSVDAMVPGIRAFEDGVSVTTCSDGVTIGSDAQEH